MSYGLRYTEDGVSLATYFCSYISFLNESQREADVFRSCSRKNRPWTQRCGKLFFTRNCHKENKARESRRKREKQEEQG